MHELSQVVSEDLTMLNGLCQDIQEGMGRLHGRGDKQKEKIAKQGAETDDLNMRTLEAVA